jgi:hypothetical protein
LLVAISRRGLPQLLLSVNPQQTKGQQQQQLTSKMMATTMVSAAAAPPPWNNTANNKWSLRQAREML